MDDPTVVTSTKELPALHRGEFVSRLAETAEWCRRLGNVEEPATSLRACKVQPSELSSQYFHVFCVALERSRRLRAITGQDPPPLTNLNRGRLLAYFPGDNLACGVAEAETRGFFDVDNIPPYDTWVWMVSSTRTVTFKGDTFEEDANYLVAWIPPDFLELVDAGIRVNPEQCIVWLHTLDDEFVRSLRELNVGFR